MKKCVLVVVVFLMTITVFSQDNRSITTIEEFNYITKGYAIQLESGLDMKRGYKLKTKLKHSSTFGKKRTTEFYDLFKDGSERPVAIMVVFFMDELPNAKSYFCIPGFHSEPDVWQIAVNYWAQMSKDWGQIAASHMWNTFVTLSFENAKPKQY